MRTVKQVLDYHKKEICFVMLSHKLLEGIIEPHVQHGVLEQSALVKLVFF